MVAKHSAMSAMEGHQPQALNKPLLVAVRLLTTEIVPACCGSRTLSSKNSDNLDVGEGHTGLNETHKNCTLSSFAIGSIWPRYHCWKPRLCEYAKVIYFDTFLEHPSHLWYQKAPSWAGEVPLARYTQLAMLQCKTVTWALSARGAH